MKRNNKKHKVQSRVNLAKRLAGYSLTAGAVLAAGGKAQAGIIYSGPLDEPFGYDYGPYDLTMEGSNPEAVFHGSNDDWFADSSNWFFVRSQGDNFLVNGTLTYHYGSYIVANKLPGSQYIGQYTNTPMYTVASFFWSLYWDGEPPFTTHTGAWTASDPSGYFGFSFDLEFESESGTPAETTVYGWGLVEGIDPANGRLLGWAYEDSGDPIHVGDTGATPIPVPSALGLAALGAAGVLSIRRRKKA